MCGYFLMAELMGINNADDTYERSEKIPPKNADTCSQNIQLIIMSKYFFQ